VGNLQMGWGKKLTVAEGQKRCKFLETFEGGGRKIDHLKGFQTVAGKKWGKCRGLNPEPIKRFL